METFSELRSLERRVLSLEALGQDAPAAFAESADTRRTSRHYTFISTAQVVQALLEAGFVVTRAQQTRVRGSASPTHARHMIRFSQTREALTLTDVIPEVVLINAHDGTGAWTMRAGLYRPICTNGLLAQMGDFGLIHVPHRGDVQKQVVEGALAITRGFAEIGAVIEQMHATQLDERQRWDFAAKALAVRYHWLGHPAPISADQALLPRRYSDYGNSLWLTYNVVQENLLQGGITGVSPKGHSTRTRAIRAIREDVRINVELWRQAMTLLRA
jgi:hypothetical protein